jgi:hypothetical protein
LAGEPAKSKPPPVTTDKVTKPISANVTIISNKDTNKEILFDLLALLCLSIISYPFIKAWIAVEYHIFFELSCQVVNVFIRKWG